MKKLWLKYKSLSNTKFYIIVSVIFLIWMLFIDTNSYLNHRKLNKEIDKLHKEKEFLKQEIEKDLKALREIKTIEGKEKLGRETYYLKKENEDIYLIEFDTIK